ncbi:3-hydroxybutyryl-CoA dehydrogenase [Phaeovibrio sulfidiphilus]|uniref:3-hydroxybutyryl-CoA dehydrogenase n=1 Tax=Phaeovibrio sulfidiphilus TaxID=1220600 RepID=A0A8J6YY63_9PROT|nr:3-hydroxybutyryl-CoA dehydrogenase [Phaeovibrio sulfidiphilus]
MDIRSVMVVGAGQMGSGIAQVMARSGLETLLFDSNAAALEHGMAKIRKNLERDVEKGRLSAADRDAALGCLRAAPGLDAAGSTDLVVEAVVETMDVKGPLFQVLDEICPPATILASNTSSLPITRLASATSRPQKVVGMHFMNPVPVMSLVELIRGLLTDDAVCQAITALGKRLGKTVVEVRDVPGFVSNRVLQVMINEAIFCVYEGVATPEGVDTVMRLGMNHPMGPLALADLIGLDTVLSILEILYEGYGDPKFRPCPLLRQYVAAGLLGRKSGRGFYDYP